MTRRGLIAHGEFQNEAGVKRDIELKGNKEHLKWAV